jgi:DNA-binding XRE family transcriptional regulator
MKEDGTYKYRDKPMFFLKTSRAIMRMTQSEFAAALGVDRWSLANWESGRIIPRATVIIAVKQLLKEFRSKCKGKCNAPLFEDRESDLV